MVKIALSAAAILASAAALVSAAPVEERATTKPRVFATGGRIEIVGPNGFNQSATFDKPGGKLSLGTMSAGLQIVSSGGGPRLAIPHMLTFPCQRTRRTF